MIKNNFTDDAEIKVGEMRKLLYGKVLKWVYVAIGLPAALIAYNIIEILNKKKFFHSLSESISDNIADISKLSHKCAPLIDEFSSFLNCLGF
jgi:hypothetical protein